MSERIPVYRGAFIGFDAAVRIPTMNTATPLELQIEAIAGYGLLFKLTDANGGVAWVHALQGATIKELGE